MSLFDEVKCIGDIFPELKDLPEVVQLCKHFKDIKDYTKIKFPVANEVKVDGVYCFVTVLHDGRTYAFGRSGLLFTNLGFVAQRFSNCCAGVYINEIANDLFTLEQLSGVTSPARVNPLEPNVAADHLAYTHANLHDYLTIEEFVAGSSNCPYSERRAYLTEINKSGEPEVKMELIHTLEEFEAASDEMIAHGEEGSCGKPLSGTWKRGRRDHNCFKKVREIKLDLECIRVEDGKGKRAGIVANMFFRWKNGTELKADLGKGYSDLDRLAMYQNPPIGKIFLVTAMQESSVNGVLRKAKVGMIREDKTVADF